jgi:CRISPR-associated exonuclease Cas4
MLGVAVPRGAIFHAASRRRRLVEFTSALRVRVAEVAAATRAAFAAATLPPPVDDWRCEGCSLREACQPTARRRAAAEFLFEPVAEPP